MENLSKKIYQKTYQFPTNLANEIKRQSETIIILILFWTAWEYTRLPNHFPNTTPCLFWREYAKKLRTAREKASYFSTSHWEAVPTPSPWKRFLSCMKSINSVLWKNINVMLLFKLGISYKGMGLSLSFFNWGTFIHRSLNKWVLQSNYVTKRKKEKLSISRSDA